MFLVVETTLEANDSVKKTLDYNSHLVPKVEVYQMISGIDGALLLAARKATHPSVAYIQHLPGIERDEGALL